MDNAKTPLDLDRLHRTTEDDREFERELLVLFISDTASRLASLTTALETQDYNTIAREAHTIKGSAANVGAMRLNALAAELEKQMRDSRLDGVSELSARMVEAFAQVRLLLEEHMTG